MDGSTGLYNYDARLYDPVIGRFVSADSLVPRVFDSMSYNRYAYCRNNPLIYVDPSGNLEIHGDIAFTGGYGIMGTGGITAMADDKGNVGVIGHGGYGAMSNAGANIAVQYGWSTGDVDKCGKGWSFTPGISFEIFGLSLTQEFIIGSKYFGAQGGVALGKQALPVSTHKVAEKSTTIYSINIISWFVDKVDEFFNSDDSENDNNTIDHGWSNGIGDDSGVDSSWAEFY